MLSVGAVVGRAKRDRIDDLWRAFAEVESIDTQELLDFLSPLTPGLRQALEPEPDSFFRLSVRLVYPSLSQDQAFLALTRGANEVVPENVAMLQLQEAVIQGIALGVSRPELVKRIWDRGQEYLSPERTSRYQAAGLKLLDNGQPLSLP
jgi:hypothetical protein